MKKLISLLAAACTLFAAQPGFAVDVRVGSTIPSEARVQPIGGNCFDGVTYCSLKFDNVGALVTSGSGGGGSSSLTPFAPTGNASLAPTGTTSRVALPSADTTVLVQNLGSVLAYVRLGDVTVNATSGDLPLQAGTAIVLSAGTNTYLAAITSGGTGSIAVTTGTGTPTFGLAMDPTAAVSVQQSTAANLKATVIGDGSVSGGSASAASIAAGAVFNTTAPTLTNGQQAALQLNTKGQLIVAPGDANGQVVTTNTLTDTLSGSNRSLFVIPYNLVFNGSSWSQQRGNTTGTAVLPNGMSAQRWSFASATSGIVNTTTAVTIKAAAGAGVKNCVAGLQIATDTLGAATELALRDGAAGTVIWRTKLQTGPLPLTSVHLPAAICGTANTLMEVVTLTAVTGGVYVDAEGSLEP